MKYIKAFYTALYLLGSFVLIGLMAAFMANITGLPFIGIAVVLFAGSLIPRPQGVAYDAVNPDISAIATFIGKVKPAIFSKLYNSLDIAKDITLVPNVKNILKLTKLIIKNGPKPYTGAFNPRSNDIGYSGRELVVDHWQRDLIIDPRKYRMTYLSDFRAAGESPNNNTIPFGSYTVQQVLNALAASVNDQTAFFGVGKDAFATYNAANTYAKGALVKATIGTEVNYFKANQAVAANDVPTLNHTKWDDANSLAIAVGLGTQIKAARDNGTIKNVVSTGSITSESGIYDQAKKVFRKLPDAIKAQGANLYMPISHWEFLADDFQDRVGKFTENDNSGIIYLANTNKKCQIVPTTWQNGSNMQIATQKPNLLMGTDLLSDMNEINTIPDVYTLKMGMAGVLGFNFQDEEAIVINDQD